MKVLTVRALLQVATASLLLAQAGCGGGGSLSAPVTPTPPGQVSPVEWQPKASTEWPVSTAAAEGLAATALDQAYQQARQTAGVAALLVVKGDRLVGEAYYPAAADTLLPLGAMTQQVVASLIGIAVAEGKISSLELPVYRLLAADYGALLNNKTTLTVGHLLTMSSGLSWNEQDATDKNWRQQPDPIRYILQRDLLTTPGLEFRLNSAATQLLAAVLQKATGLTVADYAKEKLFTPIGINQFQWQQLSDGYHNAADGLQLRARDVAKLALLWQQGGRWQQQQLIPAAFMLPATEAKLPVLNQLAGLGVSHYGYALWLGQWRNQPMWISRGLAGQLVLTLPTQQLSLILLAKAAPADPLQQEQVLSQFALTRLLSAF